MEALAEPLTRRERAILAHLAQDKSNREIAEAETLSLNSVKWYLQQIFAKLGVSDRQSAVTRGFAFGLLVKDAKDAGKSGPITLLPSGTVTFLFTDIQGSTPLWESQPDLMARALQIHNQALRQAIETYGGIVFKTVGDAFQSAFPTALQGLNAAIAAQRLLNSAPWNELGPLPVRMGLHTGTAEIDPGGDEYAVSHDKNRIGRIHSIAHGGQILLSQETADLVARRLPAGVALQDLGEHRLKGMTLPEHLFQVSALGLPASFPPLATASSHPHNLPGEMTSFIGRAKEIQELLSLLRKPETRLVTLTGPGGTGKTRLALKVGELALDTYPNGVWLAELAALAQPDLVPQAVIAALGQVELPGKTPLAQLSDFLREKHLLLILDNCEHLVESCADLMVKLLQSAPGLTILASSREILGVSGEISYRVPPLSLPTSPNIPPFAELGGFEAVRLWIERARLAVPSFALNNENAAAVVQICRRLDGIPLAIELAAARIRILSVEGIATHLDDAFRLLTGGSRNALPRHQTLTALIEWSYQLLTDSESCLLRRVSVFAGGWTLEAVEAVCQGGPIQAGEILDLLTQLADKSLVQVVENAQGPRRYRMLETVRQYAHTKLVQTGEAEVKRGRHLAFYLAQAERLEPNLRGREQIHTLDYWDEELDNLRLALEWGLQTDPLSELRLASSLMWFWHTRFHWSEGIAWLEQGLQAEKATRSAVQFPQVERELIRAKALTALGFHHFSTGSLFFGLLRTSPPVEYLYEAISLYRNHNPASQSGLGWALVFLAFCKYYFNLETVAAKGLAQEALVQFRGCDDFYGIVMSLQIHGAMEMDPDLARTFFQEQLSIVKKYDDTDGIATAIKYIADTSNFNGDYGEACMGYIASREYYRRARNHHMDALMSLMVSWTSLFNGEIERPAWEVKEALQRFLEIGLERDAAFCLFTQSLLSYREGDLEQTVALNRVLDQTAQKMKDKGTNAFVLFNRARIARLRGFFSEARKFADEGLTSGPWVGPEILFLRMEWIYLELLDERLDQARALLAQTLSIMLERNDLGFLEWEIEGLALIAFHEGKLERAARLFGTRLWRGFANLLSPAERAERETVFQKMRDALGSSRFETLREEGRSLRFMDLIALAQEI
jgi:predicted ATPase/class 3 adenylate cyclase